MEKIRLIVLSGTNYEVELCNFVTRMNTLTKNVGIKIEIVRCTGPSIGQQLFNNNGKSAPYHECQNTRCLVCVNELKNETGLIISNISGEKYLTTKNLSCVSGGIYVVDGLCSEQYTGKTIHFGVRTKEHLTIDKGSAVYQHKQKCTKCSNIKDFSVTYVENYLNRGKYSLSEREFLWNKRVEV